MTEVVRKSRGLLALGFVLSGVVSFCAFVGANSVNANSFHQAWHSFQVRCLLPFEDFKPAKVDGLVAVSGRDGAFQLENGAVLTVGGAEELGTRSCAVEGSGLVKGYKEWSALVLQTGIYRETETPGLWISHEWIEPRIIVEKTPGKIRVVESEIEA